MIHEWNTEWCFDWSIRFCCTKIVVGYTWQKHERTWWRPKVHNVVVHVQYMCTIVHVYNTYMYSGNLGVITMSCVVWFVGNISQYLWRHDGKVITAQNSNKIMIFYHHALSIIDIILVNSLQIKGCNPLHNKNVWSAHGKMYSFVMYLSLISSWGMYFKINF